MLSPDLLSSLWCSCPLMCSLTLLIASRSCTATGTLWCRTCRRLRVPTRPSRSLCKNGQAGIRACAASTVRVSGPNTPDALAAPSLTQARVHTTPVNGREKVIGVKNLPKAELHDRLNVRLPPPATTHAPGLLPSRTLPRPRSTLSCCAERPAPRSPSCAHRRSPTPPRFKAFGRRSSATSGRAHKGGRAPASG